MVVESGWVVEVSEQVEEEKKQGMVGVEIEQVVAEIVREDVVGVILV